MNEQDLQRAIDAYRFFYPTVSMEAMFDGNRDAGVADGEGLLLVMLRPHHLLLTGNSDTPYLFGVLDLSSGPVVIDLPAGRYTGAVDDHNQRWICDLGIPGPDGGRGGRTLVVPPGWDGALPADARIVRAPTRKCLLGLRAIPDDDGQRGAMDALRRVRVRRLGSDRALPFIDRTDGALDSTPHRWEDNLDYWRHLQHVLDEEPELEAYRSLAQLGLVKGKPFAPDARTTELLERAARDALARMRAEGFASERPERLVWEDRRWEWLGLVEDTNQETDDARLQQEARDRWFFQAIGTSPAMSHRAPGGGSIYFLAARDANGALLDGGHTYRLRVPAPVPARLFWSVTVYDAETRSQIQTAQGKASLGSLTDLLQSRAGTIELCFGPTEPPGLPWIQTLPGRTFFVYFRIYGPESAVFDGSWRPDDVRGVR